MRYLALTEKSRAQMLQDIGCNNFDQLMNKIDDKLHDIKIDLPKSQSELEVERDMSKLASKNISATNRPFFLGVGCYNHHIPATVDYITQRSEFMTSYTPYQPEISQGTLTTIFEYQTYITRLTGMDISNASMYDGATATAEAVLMALRINKGKNKVHIYNTLQPDYLEVLETYTTTRQDIEILQSVVSIDDKSACVVVQTPDFYGEIVNIDLIAQECKKTDTLLIVVITEILSLGLLTAPKRADIVVGEACSLAGAMSFGGPHLGFLACKKQYIRQLPGRLCGITTDVEGRRSFVLTLNAREQHIRRDKSNSNICTNQGLCALAFTVHMAILGQYGMINLAQKNHQTAIALKDAICNIPGVELLNKTFFNEFTVRLVKNSVTVSKALLEKNIISGYPYKGDKMIFAATELTTQEDIDKLNNALKEILNA